jgi:murein DD-endopeptidase MepM/ murein hydrolase activator NlpD
MLYDHLNTRLEAATASATPGAEQDIKPLNPRMGRPESIEAAENPITHDIALRTTPHVNPGLLSELEVQRRVDQLAERIIAEGADGQPRNMADQPVPGRTVAAEDAMRGVHIEAPSGTPVQAVRDGLVTFVGEQDGQRTVVVEHMDGRESVYSRVGNASVREGAPVQAGQQIATIGSNDPKSPPGLHFTIRSGPAPEPGRT